MQPGESRPAYCGLTTPTTVAAALPAVATAPQKTLPRNNSTCLAKQRQSAEVGKYTGFPARDILFHIIKWDTRWLYTQMNQEMYPPILGQIKINSVKDTYASEDEYSDTYFRLHLLNIWCGICTSWKSNPPRYQCLFEDFEEKNLYFKNRCKQLVAPCGVPSQQSIILVTYTKLDGRRESVFGYVYDVKVRRSAATDEGVCRSSPPLQDVLFSFYTDKKLQIVRQKMTDMITVQNLSKVRASMKQYESLVFGKCSALKSVILNPVGNAHKIRAVQLPTYSHCSSSALRILIDDVVQSFMSSKTLVALLQKQRGKDTWLVILTLVNNLIANSTIMICVKDAEKLHKIAEYLKIKDNDYAVLAVKASEVAVAEDFRKYTLRARSIRLLTRDSAFEIRSSKNAESEVLKSSKIILTVLSNIFLGETVTLDNSIIIIDDAHMATEAETAVAWDLSPRNVVLLGDSTEGPLLDSSLQRLDYHKTLFHRMINCGQ